MLKQRILTALILAPIAIGCTFFLPHFEFSIFIGFVLTVGAWEWANLIGLNSQLKRVGYASAMLALIVASSYAPPLPILMLSVLWWLVALYWMLKYPSSAVSWGTPNVINIMGIFALIPGATALSVLKASPDSNFLILLLFFLIWGADIGAYFSGKAFGSNKLAEKVSPGKSWEGFFGGLITAALIAVLMSYFYGLPDLGTTQGVIFLIGCVLVTMVSVLGDLVESMLKRHRGIKDSSQLLPGHGGVLDRIDSLLSAGPWFALLVLLLGLA